MTGTSTEWSSQVGSSIESIAPPSSDDVLFDAEILGDELMDIYTAAVVGGDDDDEVMKEIPTLLGPTEITLGCGNKDGSVDDEFVDDLYSSITSKTDSTYSEIDVKTNTNAAVIIRGSAKGSKSSSLEATTGTSDVLSPVVSSTSLLNHPTINSNQVTSSVIRTNKTHTNSSSSAALVGTKRKSDCNARNAESAPKRRGSTGRKVTMTTAASSSSSLAMPPSSSKKLHKKHGTSNNKTPNPLLTATPSPKNCGTIGAAGAVTGSSVRGLSHSTTKSTVTNKKEGKKALLAPIKVESVNQLLPNAGIVVTPPPPDSVESSASCGSALNTTGKMKITNASASSASTNMAVVTSKRHTTTVVFSKAKHKSSAGSNSAVPASVISNPPTEADFKSVAKAAVNDLIMNVAGNGSKANNAAAAAAKLCDNKSKQELSSSSTSTASTPRVKRIDTSTEHVKALTGSNWVAVCGGGGNAGSANNGSAVAGGGNGGDNSKNGTNNQNSNDKNCSNRSRRSNLTQEERARQNRDRNREHARNTRLRKKAYVEELKATLSALVTQRDASELERRHASQRELEQREVRFRVLEEFLKLRGRSEPNPARWSAILEDNFRFTIPDTDFRDMVHSDVQDRNKSYEQVLTGVVDVMHDSTLCSTFLQSILGKGDVAFSYNCDRTEFFMDNCRAILDWTATASAPQRSSSGDDDNDTTTKLKLVINGQIQAKFSPASNKLISAVMRFDTGAIKSQINRIAKLQSSTTAVEAAAQVAAANEADALLDSLQMPHFDPPNKNNPGTVNYVPPPSSVSSANNSIDNSDDDKDEIEENFMF